jgi:dimeric dUTPase (all-alpha-NTP-PPase superfamily)
MEQYDMLADLFARQKAAQEARGYQFPMEGQNAADYIKSHTLHCVDELMEMLHEVKGYKEWKVYDFDDTIDNKVQRTKAKKELVDAVHFLINVALALNISAADLYLAYKNKEQINYNRLKDTRNYKKDTE